MTKHYYLLLAVPAVLIGACGQGSIDGAADAAIDQATSVDAAKDARADVVDANDDDVVSEGDADADTQSDAQGSNTIFCLVPADCIDGGAPDAAYPPDSGEVCCATLTTTGSFPDCDIVSLAMQCASPGSCNTDISYACTTETGRGCQYASECTEPGYDQCCAFDFGGDAGLVQVCVGEDEAELSEGCAP